MLDYVKNIFSIERFKRQQEYIGEPGQRRLAKTVCIVGLGGLGTCSSDQLVRSGVKSLKLIDNDTVTDSNLQRQVLYYPEDIGKPKVDAAAKSLRKINSSLAIIKLNDRLRKENLRFLDSDIVLDCTDNVQSRFLINSYCVRNNIPWIYCTVAAGHGFAKAITKGTACLRCFHKARSRPENSSNSGVFNAAVQMASSIQVSIAMQILLEEACETRLISFDTWNSRISLIDVEKNKRCAVCR